jgi:hypothetical protein
MKNFIIKSLQIPTNFTLKRSEQSNATHNKENPTQTPNHSCRLKLKSDIKKTVIEKESSVNISDQTLTYQLFHFFHILELWGLRLRLKFAKFDFAFSKRAQKCSLVLQKYRLKSCI